LHRVRRSRAQLARRAPRSTSSRSRTPKLSSVRAESMEHLKRAVAIFSEVGADEATRLPEIWKLVSW
jgi:hypothetical protein